MSGQVRNLQHHVKNANHSNMNRQMVIEDEMELLSEAAANVKTPGFQVRMPHMKEHVQHGISYVAKNGHIRDLNRGAAKHTGAPHDLYLSNGYFAVQAPDGVRYTLNGHFRINEANQLTTSDGYPVLSAGGAPIEIPASTNIRVLTDGSISGEKGEFITKIQVSTFADEQAMDDDGMRGYFRTAQPAIVPDRFEVIQGAVIGSNVRIVEVMGRLAILGHHWNDSHSHQNQEDETQFDVASKLAPVN